MAVREWVAELVITLEQLRVFVEVAEQLHVTRAAAVLNITQSGASAAILALETRLGTALFDRVGRRLELTEVGRVLLPEAKSILAKVSGAERVLAELDSLLRGRLCLWASQTIAGYWLPPFLYRFRAVHPRLIIELHIGNSAQVSRAVPEGTADLGFVEGPIDEPKPFSNVHSIAPAGVHHGAGVSGLRTGESPR